MASSQSSKFNLYDILTRVIPGASVVIPFLLLTYQGDFSILTGLTGIGLFTLVLSSFLMGEVVNLIRENASPVPTLFRRALYTETEEAKYLGYIDHRLLWFDELTGRFSMEFKSIYSSTDRKLHHELKNEFDLDGDFDNIRDLYSLLLIHLDSRMSSRTRRFQTSYTFFQNTKWGMIVGILLLIINGVDPGNEQAIFYLSLGFSMIVLILLMSLITAFSLYGRVEKIYVCSLILEFFYEKEQEVDIGDLEEQSIEHTPTS